MYVLWCTLFTVHIIVKHHVWVEQRVKRFNLQCARHTCFCADSYNIYVLRITHNYTLHTHTTLCATEGGQISYYLHDKRAPRALLERTTSVRCDAAGSVWVFCGPWNILVRWCAIVIKSVCVCVCSRSSRAHIELCAVRMMMGFVCDCVCVCESVYDADAHTNSDKSV